MPMLKKIGRAIGHFYNKFEEYLLCASLVFTVTIVFLQVIMRYIFNSSFYWSEELTRYIFIWQIWLGCSIAQRENVHIRVEMIFGILKGKAVHIAEIVSALIWFGFCIFVVYYSYGWISYSIQQNTVSAAMHMPMAYAYLSVPVGCAMMGLRLIGVLYKQFRYLFGLDTPPSPDDPNKNEAEAAVTEADAAANLE